MFMGHHIHKIDARDRLSIPVRMREELYRGGREHPIITVGFEKCLFLYPMERWKNFSEEAESLKTSREDSRKIERFLFANASECPFDSQGRILVAKHLLDYAQLNKDVVIIGVRNRIELWDKSEWETQSMLMRKTVLGVSENIEGFSI